jgi:magnesium-transporting ATPase (P-type)
MYPKLSDGDSVLVVKKSMNPKLKKLAMTLWTVSGSFFTLYKTSAETGLWEDMQPLIWIFQEMALGLGVLAIIAGLILLVVKKRWGQVTLKTTAIIILGVFLIPSALMLLAIIGTYLNDALYTALQKIREAKAVTGR